MLKPQQKATWRTHESSIETKASHNQWTFREIYRIQNQEYEPDAGFFDVKDVYIPKLPDKLSGSCRRVVW